MYIENLKNKKSFPVYDADRPPGNKKAAPESFRGGIKGLKDSSAERGCDYFVTRSSHLTMASMAIIETAQTITKILHVAEIEIRL